MLLTPCLLLAGSQIAPTPLVDEWVVRAIDESTGRPVPGVRVWGYYELGFWCTVPAPLADAVTDADGRARIDLSGLTGLHEIEREVVEMTAVFSGPGWQTDSISATLQEVAVGPRDDPEAYARNHRDLELSPGRSLTVRVVDERGRPVTGAFVEAGVWSRETSTWEPGANCYQSVTDSKGRILLDVGDLESLDVHAWDPTLGAGSCQLNKQQVEDAIASVLVIQLDAEARPVVSTDDRGWPLSFHFDSGFIGGMDEGGLEDSIHPRAFVTVRSPDGHPIRGAYVQCSSLNSPSHVGSFTRRVRSDRAARDVGKARVPVISSMESGSYVATASVRTQHGEWWGETSFETQSGDRPPEIDLRLEWREERVEARRLEVAFLDATGTPIPEWRAFVESVATGRPLFSATQRGVAYQGTCIAGYCEPDWEPIETRILLHASSDAFDLPVELEVDLAADVPRTLTARSPGLGGRLRLSVPFDSDFPGDLLLARLGSSEGRVLTALLSRRTRDRGRPIVWHLDPERHHVERAVLLPPGDWSFTLEHLDGNVVTQGTASIAPEEVTDVEMDWP
ncbi:hypothetical protein Poly30_08070 [Planctomycetes bacterium Poly30]|uniref:Carboxypeptidase regulatory-like domain-containing protein n=1 Tax=Saltatorellus ferox TaxID=2528018 RepID=A0A518EMM4_9BACT|nr:hypothetical protein Poly30_08070 [Planctomycetes bacterium Poly30]